MHCFFGLLPVSKCKCVVIFPSWVCGWSPEVHSVFPLFGIWNSMQHQSPSGLSLWLLKTRTLYFIDVFFISSPYMKDQPWDLNQTWPVGQKWCLFINAPKILGALPPKFGAQKHQITDHSFHDFRTQYHISPEQTSQTNKNSSVNLQYVLYKLTYFPWPLTQKRLRSVCLLWPTLRRPLRCSHQSFDISSYYY